MDWGEKTLNPISLVSATEIKVTYNHLLLQRKKRDLKSNRPAEIGDPDFSLLNHFLRKGDSYCATIKINDLTVTLMCRIPVNSPKAVTCRLLHKTQNLYKNSQHYKMTNVFTKFDTNYTYVCPSFWLLPFLTINIMNLELHHRSHLSYELLI